MCGTKGFDTPKPCTPGTYQPSTGASTCIECTAGKYTSAPAQKEPQLCPKGTYSGAKASTCAQCDQGKFAQNPGSSDCQACTGEVYQPDKGQDHCLRCPPGYMVRPATSRPTKLDGYTDVLDACVICPAGKYSSNEGSKECMECSADWYNPLQGQSKCLQCPNNKTTSLVQGCTSISNCTCGTGKYDPGTGFCLPCGECLLNEYVVSPCGDYSNVQCAACASPCPGGSKDQFVVPAGMCNGHGTTATQSCAQCRQEQQCSQKDKLQYNRLWACRFVYVCVCVNCTGFHKMMETHMLIDKQVRVRVIRHVRVHRQHRLQGPPQL